MVGYIFLAIHFFSLLSWASGYKVIDSQFLQPSLLRYNSLAKIFQNAGFSSPRDQSFVLAGRSFDFVFVSPDWQKWILLKEGLQAPAKESHRVITSKELSVQVANFEYKGGHYVLLASGLSARELSTILKPIFKSPDQALFLPLTLFAEHAFANDCSKTDPHTPFQLTAKHIQNNELLKTIGKCGADAIQGAQTNVTNTLNFFKTLALNPLHVWKEMRDSFLELRSFVFNLHTELEKIIGDLQGLTLEQRLTLGCNLTGQLMLVAVTATAVGTTNLAQVLPQILLKLKNSTVMIAKLAELKKRGFNIPDLNESSRKVLACVR